MKAADQRGLSNRAGQKVDCRTASSGSSQNLHYIRTWRASLPPSKIRSNQRLCPASLAISVPQKGWCECCLKNGKNLVLRTEAAGYAPALLSDVLHARLQPDTAHHNDTDRQ